MAYVVHVLSGDLILHRRTLDPIKTMIYGLRRYDLDRCAALIDSSHGENPEQPKVVGFMSHKSKIYLVRSLASIVACALRLAQRCQTDATIVRGNLCVAPPMDRGRDTRMLRQFGAWSKIHISGEATT